MCLQKKYYRKLLDTLSKTSDKFTWLKNKYDIKVWVIFNGEVSDCYFVVSSISNSSSDGRRLMISRLS